jgi:chorismate mutase
MEGKTAYFVVKKRALPEVLLKVVEVNRLLETQKVSSVQEAVDRVGISRSSYYKYKEDIFPFHDSTQGKTLTLSCRMDDEPGLLSDVLKVVADFGANILTIHQSIPINGIATLSLSIQILDTTGDVSDMVTEMEKRSGVHNVKVLGRD